MGLECLAGLEMWEYQDSRVCGCELGRFAPTYIQTLAAGTRAHTCARACGRVCMQTVQGVCSLHTAVRFLPKVLDDGIDLIHFAAVVFH